jgi:hypothetical protein
MGPVGAGEQSTTSMCSKNRAHSWRRHCRMKSGVLRPIPRACRARWERSLVKKSCSRAANLSRALSGRKPLHRPQRKARRARGRLRGGRASPRAMRVSESLAPRQADAASFYTIAFAADQGARWRQESHQRGPRGKFPPKPRRVQIGSGIEQIRHGWFAGNAVAIWGSSRK